jgi:Family of unknown function (DUF6505)
VPGAFMFVAVDPAELTGKARAEFRAGLLGIASFGWSTLAQIVDASDEDRMAATEQLARQFVAHLDAPDVETARPHAAHEIEFTSSLCSHPAGTLIAVRRTHEGDDIRETFRSLHQRDGAKPLRAFSFLEVEGDERPGEEVDLAALARDRK